MAQKILVIDDTPATAQLAEHVLRQGAPGSDVLTATRGAEGFERFHSVGPDVIVVNDALQDIDTAHLLARFAADPLAAQTPIVLLADPSTNGALTRQFPNLRVLPKPVTPDSFREALASLAPALPGRRQHYAAQGPVAFSGNTSFVSLRQALAMAQGDRLTGVLRVPFGKQPVELWMHNGRFILATTRNFHLYAGGSPIILPATNLGQLLEAQLHQQATGCPLFLHLSARNGFAHDDAVPVTREHGQRLFASLCTAGRISFEFEETDVFPDYVKSFPPSADDADNWLLGALRHVRLEQLQPGQRPDPNGAPAYTRRGYDLIRKLKLNDVETRFAGEINGTTPLPAIAEKLSLPLADALLVVYRFQVLDIIDYWSAGALGLPAAS